MKNMEVDSERVIAELLEQNKQMTLQLSVARALVSQLKEILTKLENNKES